MAIENLLKCDGCGRTVERDVADISDAGGVVLAEGWVHVAVWNGRVPEGGEDAGSADRIGQFCNKKCAAKWVAKRERRRKPAENAAL